MSNIDDYKIQKFSNLFEEFESYTKQFFPEFLSSNPKPQKKLLDLRQELEKNKSVIQYQIVDDSSQECIEQIENIRFVGVEHSSIVTVLENTVNILKFNEKILLSNLKSLEQMNNYHIVH